jgi:hypothetical protein
MTNPQLLIDQENRYTEARIKIKVPQKYYQEPILNYLVVNHNLEVNFLGALLGANGQNDGWFDLVLKGHSEQINNALLELAELDVEVWHISGQETDGW